MKAITASSAILGLFLGFFLSSAQAQERVTKSCNRPNTEVSFRYERDYDDACMALTNVEDFFHLYGHNVETPIKVEFRQKVKTFVDGELVRVHSLYDEKNDKILVTSINSDFLTDPERVNFGIRFADQNDEIRRDYQISRITHELTRPYIENNLDAYEVENLASVFKKFIAYVVQLTTMRDTDLKNKIRNHYSDANLSSIEDISKELYEEDPQKFGVMAFKLFNGQDGKKLLSRILHGEVQLNNGDGNGDKK